MCSVYKYDGGIYHIKSQSQWPVRGFEQQNSKYALETISKSKSGLLAKTSGVVTVSEIRVFLIFLIRYRRCRSVLLSMNFYLDLKNKIYTIILT